MIIAKDSNGNRYDSLKLNVITDIKNNIFYCPNCDKEVMFVNSVTKIRHFRHYDDNECSSEPDTEQHTLFKKQIYDILVKAGYSCNYEVKIGNRVADIYGVGRGLKLVVECQLSPISPEELKARDYDYHKLGFETIWIFHLSNYARLIKLCHTKNNHREYAIFSLKRVERDFNGDKRIRYFDGKSLSNLKFYPQKKWTKNKNEDNYKTRGILWTDFLSDRNVIESIAKLQEKTKETKEKEYD